MILPEKELFHINDVAGIFQVHPRTVRNWIESGKIRAIKYVGNLRIARKDLVEFERKGERTT